MNDPIDYARQFSLPHSREIDLENAARIVLAADRVLRGIESSALYHFGGPQKFVILTAADGSRARRADRPDADRHS